MKTPTTADSEAVERLAREDTLSQTVRRAQYFSYILFVAFLAPAYSTLAFLQELSPQVTLWNNFWPRLLFNSLPWLFCAAFLKSKRLSNKNKIVLWTVLYGVIFISSAMVHVWPLAMSGHPTALLFISGANGALFVGIWAILSVPVALIPLCFAVNFFLVCCPLFYVAWASGNKTIFMSTVNDTLFLNLAGFACGYVASKVYYELATIKAQKQMEAAKFLGNEVYSAIFEGKEELLEEDTRNGYVLFIDIRNSTLMMNNHKDRWDQFNKEWMATASEIVPRFRGNLLKTGGDSLLITFGIFDEAPVDLSDIPGIEHDERAAEDRRWRELSHHSFKCTHELFVGFQELAKKHFPETPLRIGAGLDRGPVTRGLRGSDHKMELDIWGDRVNCAARLQDHSKTVAARFKADSSLLVISPYAGDYLGDQSKFLTLPIRAPGIKDFPGLKWVLVKEYDYHQKTEIDPGVKAA